MMRKGHEETFSGGGNGLDLDWRSDQMACIFVKTH